MSAVRVVIADDHRLFRRGIAALLAAVDGIEVVGEAADGDDAVRLAVELRPDVVLVDDAIARALGYSPKTVRNYVSILFAKLGVDDRAQAIVLAREHGLR